MKHNILKIGALAVVAAMAAAVAFSGSASAQTPGPTQTVPYAARGTGMAGSMGMGMRGRANGIGGPENSLVAVAAKALNLSQTDLVATLNTGKTIADVATEKGVSLTGIVDAFIAPRVQMVQSAVTAGTLTQAQADANIATMKANVTAQLSAKFTPRGNGTGTGFVDTNNDGVCDNYGANSQTGRRGRMGGRGR